MSQDSPSSQESTEGKAARLGELLRTRGLSISTAESLTGGMLGAAITGTPGASDYYLGGAITYATETKARILSVDEQVLASQGPVSPATAEQMAHGVRRLYASSIAVATTGVAGPTGQDGKPVGLVYIGISDADSTQSHEFHSTGTSRDEVRRQTVEQALEILIGHLEKG
ncbi:CinA family protein [Streptomyces sp. TLI_146]|uniref:CinA family protein n=1 Tax=Streptomyces sp. TLI_146 TaxID=1938858 RepID=UPI000CAC267F|nr:CinA family protein [Streptomyces sp. TLI_146]PKV89879.1 nicotinamide-nucleotide amidase [Streptomyces sp. TLI_146]